ncbi:MAG: N-6 DNA methylase [Bacilli bacterium]|nr:N-6 DNA methylase [Bacilli bacterium]MDD4718380.1 N-6 DNA methylase [Bacilli bacterium]
MNERITESFFRNLVMEDDLYTSGLVTLEEQKSSNPKINKLLVNASKSGMGQGYPEFIISFDYEPELLMVVECKADKRKHESTTGDNYKDYSVDGVKLYASFLSKEFDVIAVAISGTDFNDLRVSTYIHLKGTALAHKNSDFKEDSFYTLDEYIDVLKKDEKKFNQDYNNLLSYTKELNEHLHGLKIPESDRSLLISGCLIALNDRAFYSSYKYHEPKELAMNLFNTIKSKLEFLQKDNIEEIMVTYGFIKTHVVLSRQKDKLKEIIERIDLRINSFIKTHKYFDALGQFYIEFLRYANSDKGLGIVLTPPHITELFSDIAKVNSNSVVLDNCTGTGGFLISAMNRMVKDAGGDKTKEAKIKKNQLIGIEFSDKIFALTCSNMYIHGDGRSNLFHGSCFDRNIIEQVKKFKPNVGFLNPPYKDLKDDIEEFQFIINNLELLEKGSLCIAIIPMSCALADRGERLFLKEKILKNNTLDAVFSMPIELFHNSKVSVNTCIMVFRAKEPHPKHFKTYFADWKNDGFTKRKTLGRNDYDGLWEQKRKKWLSMYFNRDEEAGFSIKQSVTPADEWCAEAYMETDYSVLEKSDFEDTVKKYAIFKLRNNLVEEVLSKPIHNNFIELDLTSWEEFEIEGVDNSLFNVTGSQSFTKTEIKEYGEGKFPYVVTSSENNGIEGFYNHFTENGNILTIDSATVGSCFYQEFNFSASDHVEKLIPCFKEFNKYSALFIVAVINLEQIRYGYGRKFAQKRIKTTKIKLPSKNGMPDFEYMENYIKSLNYSKSI